MNRSGCEVHALQINSYGVRPLRVISNALALQSGPQVCRGGKVSPAADFLRRGFSSRLGVSRLFTRGEGPPPPI